MGRKGQSTTLKRKPAPRFWPIHRKDLNWVVKPSAGTHSTENCLSLAVALRDVLGLVQTRKEAKRVVTQGGVLVDGKIMKKDNFPVGLMDVISLPNAEEHFRVLPSSKGLVLLTIDKKEAEFKLCRVEDKKVVDKGQVQLNLHDGTNILVKIADPKNPQEDIYKSLDTLTVSLPDRQILGRIEMKQEALAMITGGKNIGSHGRIVEIEKVLGKKRGNILVTIEDEKRNRYQTVLDFVFAVGEKQPLIALPEAN